MSDAPDDDDAVDLVHRLLDLARAGDSQVLSYVDAGVPVDLTDPQGNTLLMVAAYHGHPSLVTGLAGRGADVDHLNDRGRSPLAGAVFTGEADVVRALVGAGADADRGSPTARQSATFFERDDLGAMLPEASP